jgi:cellulose 1,4-beta-cellobiosidase
MRFRARHATRRLRTTIAAVGAALIAALGLAAAAAAEAPSAGAATASCSATYSVTTDWGTGFQVALNITNNGSTAITGWTITYSYTGNQTLANGWDGTWTQSGETVTVTNESYNGDLAAGASTPAGANFNYSGTNTAPTSVTCTPAGSVTPPPTTPPPTSPTPTPTTPTPTPTTPTPTPTTPTPTPTTPTPTPTTPTPTPTSTGSCGSGISLQANPATFSVAQGGTDVFGVSLSASPAAAITVSVAETSGNTGLSVSSGSSITLSSSNWNLPQPVYVTANSSSTGATTFTVSASGCTSVTVSGTETAASSGTTQSHVTNPFTGSSWYVNPDYTAEADSSAASASGTLASQMEYVGTQPTFIWLDHIGAIYGGSDNASGINNTDRMSLEAQLQNAASEDTSGTPMLFPIVIYDLPDRDCAALASNGELSISNNGLSYYENAYINPIAQILSNYEHTNLRIVAVIEPDSLPNLVTNESVTNCANANSSGVYEDGIEYALNKLHAIPNVYNYLDIAHSAWLGWPSNMSPAVTLYKQVASATTAGVSSVDGFISDTANTIPVVEPYMTATETVDGNAVDSVLYYSYDPYIEELTYDEAMYSNLVSAGFPSTVGMLIDTSRDGWGDPSLRPTEACPTTTCTTTTEFVNDSKIDERPFRGDWCNPENAGIGALPQANPMSSFPNLYAYVWVKPPGESDGTYPAYSGTGDPHCDPNGTQTDGSGNSYPTDAIPDSPPAGHWFSVEFNQLVQDASPAIP